MNGRVPRRFVRHAPSKFDKSRVVDVRMTDMVARDAAWWDARLGPKHAGLAKRADRFWAWSVLLPLCHLVQLVHRRSCRPLVIWARTDAGRFLRVGMAILIESYPFLDATRPADSHFVWFISAADPEILKSDFGMSSPPALARVHLDNAIVLSQNAGCGGRIGLHAAVAGGDALLKVYACCGLMRLPIRVPLAPGIKRKNDGRFFVADEERARDLAAMLDPRR